MPVVELGQLAVVARGEVLPDLAQLALDEMEVVDQPFGGRSEKRFLPDRFRELAIRSE
jgi:hypothetical protein